jgi:hypothetical protein
MKCNLCGYEMEVLKRRHDDCDECDEVGEYWCPNCEENNPCDVCEDAWEAYKDRIASEICDDEN